MVNQTYSVLRAYPQNWGHTDQPQERQGMRDTNQEGVTMDDQKMYMNPFTGSVDTMENWIADSKEWEGNRQAQLDSLVEVVRDGGEWIEARTVTE